MNSIIRKFLQYLYLKPRNPADKKNLNLRFMHGMNRISILMFLVAIIVLVVRCFK